MAAEVIRLLLVEDHELVAEGLRAVLARQPDLELVGDAATLAEGERLVADLAPDLVVMDQQLPDGDGTDAAARLRDAHPDTRVIILTGTDSEDVLARAIEAGCEGFITKGRPVTELVDAIRAVHLGEAALPAKLLARVLPRLRPGARRVGEDLTPRELDVLEGLARGMTNPELATELGISPVTVRNHVQNILTKLHAHSKLEAVVAAARAGIIAIGPE